MALPKLLIADSDAGFCQALATQLEGVCLCRCAQDGIAARQLLWTFSPDAAVVDLMLPGTDGLSLLQEAADHGFHPSVLAVTGYLSDYVLEALGRLQEDPRATVTELLRSLKVPVHVQGYTYLREAILLASLKPGQGITKELYPAVAHRAGVTAAQVERAIRTAVTLAFQGRDAQLWRYYFPSGSQPRKPSNGAFITRLADELLLLCPEEDRA